MTATPTPITLYPKRSRMIWLLLGCSIFVAIGIWMGSEGESFGYVGAAFFGLGIPISLIQMIPGSGFLTIDEKGFTFASLFRKDTIAWSDIDEFCVVTLGHTRFVGLNFVPTYDRSRTGRRVSRVIAGCEGALPDTYGKKAAELAELLNTRLQEARGRSTS
jgi:hypothetical protein